MDALSDVLQAVRLTGAIFFDVRASEPWVAETPAGKSIVARMFPESDHLISYHLITRGTAWVQIRDDAPLPLQTGDIVILPHGDTHVLSSSPGLRNPPDLDMYRRPEDGHLPVSISMGVEGGECTQFICGFLGCDARPFNPLLAALPHLIKVSDNAGGALATYAQFALTESRNKRIGGGSVLGRLSELMFLDAVRRYLETLPADRMNWLAGLRDPHISRALAALHKRPSQAWTLDSLAREAALSRSGLADRFMQFVGQPPMQYLASWRMQLAVNYLRSGKDSVASIAHRTGYDSESAFSRAFKKAVGKPPSEWRNQGQ